MGGQHFGKDTDLISMNRLRRILHFDRERGTIEAEAGIQWPELVDYLLKEQKGEWPQWGIVQKQTGADRLSLGGALSANVHGRGLKFRPIIQDVESFTLMDANGELFTCSRTENPELFRLTIGGYGLFGVITSVKLRLMPRTKLERTVEVIDLKDAARKFDERIKDGFLYGDFQYSTDDQSEEFLRKGVFSFYRPVDGKTPIPEVQKELKAKDWEDLYYLGHTDKKKAFQAYSHYYLTTNGQIYWSDIHQMSVYLDDYHRNLDKRLGAEAPATEMISELYVPRNKLSSFMEGARALLKEQKGNVIYGTVRLIGKDGESFLAWAREDFACVIFNLHVVHTPEGLEKAQSAFRGLIDLALKRGGSYFLTYHRWARKDQVLKAYPQFPEFLRLKKKYDPEERFQSEWYRHYKKMFADEI
jgi:FAD/FMN-containing dehydrogenase